MKKAALCFGLIALLLAGNAMAATEEAKQLAIDNGLAWLASTQTTSGAEGYWPYANYGTVAATAAAALAFVEAGYLPGDGSIYDDVITKAVTYIFNRATVDSRFGVEPAYGYPFPRYAEDYNNDGVGEGNNQAIFFDAGTYERTVYTTGIVSAVVYALGDSLGRNTVVGIGSAAINGKTYAQAMQDIVDWFSWGQVEPNMGNYRGGWRYDANYGSSDNSTAQWGALPLLYASAWGLGVPQYVFTELELWVNYIQNPNGGSGYDNPNSMVNISKTGGLLLELAAIGAGQSDSRVVAALNYINGEWNTTVNNTWDGNFNNAYTMWAVYKGLQVQGYWPLFDCGGFQIRVGEGVPAAPGGFTICSEGGPSTSAAGDWYSHYCDYLVGIQNGDGSWSGASQWTGSLATGWYINILKAAEVPPPNKPPVANAGPDITVECTGNSKATVMLDGTGSSDADGDTLTYEWWASGISFDDATSPTPTAEFPLGTTLVTLTVNDGKVNSDFPDTVFVTVEDTTPPEISVELNTYVLWPPNHKMVDITATVTTTDACCATTFELVSITSNEPDNGLGDGNTIGDIKGATFGRPDVAFQLRAERSGTGTGRVYTILYAVEDCAGNAAYDTVQVCVPHDGGLGDEDPQLPEKVNVTALLPGYPNPFNPTITIPFDLAAKERVSLQIFDTQGRLVRTLCNDVVAEGTHEAIWDGRDNAGGRVATGVYFVRFTAGNYQVTRKLVMVR
jgi:hypothetical protein